LLRCFRALRSSASIRRVKAVRLMAIRIFLTG
jgi:hypothetical protein